MDALEWDVKLYLALNGAVHDAAVAAWGLKGHYDSVRPISMIRYMGGKGQSSDPDGPSYDPEGLPLEDGLIEVITDRVERARRATRGARRPRRRDRRESLAGVPRGPDDRDERRRLDPGGRLGAVSAGNVCHALRSRAMSRGTARSAERPQR